jgi:hypothetical protein
MLDTRNNYTGPRYDIMGRELPPREKSNSFDAEQVYHSDLLNQDFNDPLVMAHAEQIERMKRNVPTAAEVALEAMSRDEWEPLLRAGANREYAAETAPLRTETGNIFVLAHPTYLDNERNAKKMATALAEAGKSVTPTIRDFENAYQKLVQAGEIEFNTKAAAKQDNERIIAAAQRHREEITFDPEEAENLPLEELYRRGGGGLNRGR